MLKFDWNLLFTFVNLIVFFVFMRLFLFKPIKRTIQARKELIEKQFKDADDVSKQADEKLADYEQRIADVEAEGEQIIADAKADAKVEYSKIIDRANADADKIRQDAKLLAQEETENARRASKEELTALVMQAAEKIVKDSVSIKTDSDIFDEFLKENN